MIPIIQTMKQYNEANVRFKKAENFYESDIPLEKKQTFDNDLQILVNHMGGLIQKIEDMNYKVTAEEVLEGFRQVNLI